MFFFCFFLYSFLPLQYWMILIQACFTLLIFCYLFNKVWKSSSSEKLCHSFFFFFALWIYCIWPNYRTMHLSFSNLLGKLVVKYVFTYTTGTLKKDQGSTYLMIHVQCLCVLLFFPPDFLYKSISRVERKTMVTQTYFWNPCLGATWTPL